MKILRFRSDRFRPYLSDDCQVNPNVLGFELADWLARELAGIGIETSYPIGEDWGWFLERTVESAETMICCTGSLIDEATGAYEWQVFIRNSGWPFRRRDPSEKHKILEAIQSLLARSGIPGVLEEDYF